MMLMPRVMLESWVARSNLCIIYQFSPVIMQNAGLSIKG